MLKKTKISFILEQRDIITTGMKRYADGQLPSAYPCFAVGVVYAEGCPRRKCPSAELCFTVGVAFALGVGYADG
jgi:hypothetical protein